MVQRLQHWAEQFQVQLDSYNVPLSLILAPYDPNKCLMLARGSCRMDAGLVDHNIRMTDSCVLLLFGYGFKLTYKPTSSYAVADGRID